MKETVKKFVELSEKYEELRKQSKIVKEELTALMKELGVGTYFQDENTKIVYKLHKPNGTFVSFDEISYDRTKKPDETKGTLSKKEAQEKGFTVD